MARGKKKEKALTPEEKLAQALVPESEHPYKVPDNWCWTKGSAVFNDMETRKPEGEYFKYIDIDAIDNSTQTVTEPKRIAVKDAPSRASRAVHYGDTVFSLVRPYLKNIAFIDETLKDCIASTGFFVCSPSPIIIPRYLYWLMTSSYVVEGLNQYMKGDNSPSIRKDDIDMFAYPVPPLAEQQRIVDRIESLFAKLDEAKEKSQSVLDSFETRKAAILHKAFTGELTAKWRVTQGIGMDSWKESTVGNVCHEVKVGIVIKPSQYYTDAENGTPAFRSANVRENRIDDFDWVYLNQTGMESNKRSIVHTGDVLVVRSGNPGTACVVSEKFDGYNAIDILIAVPNQDYISSDFLCSYTNSPFGKNLVSEKKRGMALSHFNVKGYSALPIRVPTLPEQKEVIRILDSLLAKEQSAKEAAEAVLDKINLLKKSILARAFRGELRTNAPTDEPAIELLKRIL